MIDKNVVARIVEEWLEDKSYFLVDVNVSPDDKIVVEIDQDVYKRQVLSHAFTFHQ